MYRISTTRCGVVLIPLLPAIPRISLNHHLHRNRLWTKRCALHADATPCTTDENVLPNLVSWLVANGAVGLGPTEGLGLFNDPTTGERGLACAAPWTPAPSILARVPLRLALVDVDGDKEDVFSYDDAPWSVRLACKLLRERAKGPASPWSHYIAALPVQVPRALDTLRWDSGLALAREYPAMARLIDEAAWLEADAWARLSPEATGGSTRDEFGWAMGVCHSRAFATPGRESKSIRMLIPLVDMINHAGDIAFTGPGGGFEPFDNLEWKVVAPGANGNNTDEWAIHLISRVDGADDPVVGQEVFMSYGERVSTWSW
jgi:hypothetical protein